MMPFGRIAFSATKRSLAKLVQTWSAGSSPFYGEQGSTSPTPASLGGQVGDILITFGGGTASRPDMTMISTMVYWKVLTSADLNQPRPATNLAIIRGASKIVQKVTGSGSTSAITTAGFVKNARHAGVLTVVDFSYGSGGPPQINGRNDAWQTYLYDKPYRPLSGPIRESQGVVLLGSAQPYADNAGFSFAYPGNPNFTAYVLEFQA